MQEMLEQMGGVCINRMACGTEQDGVKVICALEHERNMELGPDGKREW